MEIIERKKQRKVLSFITPNHTFLFVGFGILSVFLEKAFLFNPLILVVLYLSIEKSLLQYLFTFIAMSLTAFFIHTSYGLEIVLISFVLFLLHQVFQKIEIKNKKNYRIDLILFCGMLTVLMCVKSWSILHLGLCLLSTTLTLLWVHELEKIHKALEDEEKSVNDFTLWISALFLFALSMVHPILGFIFLRFLLLLLPSDKKMLAISIVTTSALLLLFLYQYPISYVAMIIVPTFLATFFPKKRKLIAFFISHWLVFLFLDPLFYTNGLFYQGFVVMILYLMLAFKIEGPIEEFIHRSKKIENEEMRSYQKETHQAIASLYEYIAAMDFELGKQEKTPSQKAKAHVYREVCAKCSHLLYCPLTQQLEMMVKDKISPTTRKSINRDCISPYKLTLCIQQSNAIFINEENYFQECLRRKEAIEELIASMKSSLQAIKNYSYQKDYQRETLIAHFALQGISVEDIYFKKEKLIFIINQELTPQQESEMENTILQVLKEKYDSFFKEKILFSSSRRYVFKKAPLHQIAYVSYQKGCQSDANGDQFRVLQKDTEFLTLLCDGMGHDQRAERTAKSLLNSFLALYQHSKDVKRNLNQLNRLFRISLDGDNYSTFDFFSIQLQTLELKNFKGGSGPTFIIREGKLLTLPVGGLPIGLLDEVDVEEKRIQLEPNDILLLVSDGISQFIQEQNPVIYQNIENKNDFFRNLFQLSVSSMKHFDDATMIVCEIL